MATQYDDQQNSYYNRHQHNNSFSYNKRPKKNEGEERRKTRPWLPTVNSRKSHGESEAWSRQSQRRPCASDPADARRDSRTDRKSEEKSKLRQWGSWSEYRSSSGKIYYYNHDTEVSQWEKPPGWDDSETNFHDERGSTSNDVSSGSSASTGQWSLSEAIPQDKVRNSNSSSSRRWRQKREERGRGTKREGGDSEVAQPRKRPAVASPAVNDCGIPNSSSASRRVGESDRDSRSSQLDLSKLPQLLVELAEKHKIDLHEESAVEKLKLYLKVAVKPKAEGSVECESGVCSESAACPEEPMDTSPPSSSSPSVSGAEEPEPPRQLSLPPLPDLSWTLSSFCRDDLAGHVRGWAAQHFEAQASVLSDSALQNNLRVGQLSADLKCARSLVRTAEIRSTLLEQRVLFVRQQSRQLDAGSSKHSAVSGPNHNIAVS